MWILECKTAHYDMQFKWANGAVPRHYELQVRHYMSVMNIDVAFIACLFSNNENDFVWQKIERDLEEEENTIMELAAFWSRLWSKSQMRFWSRSVAISALLTSPNRPWILTASLW